MASVLAPLVFAGQSYAALPYFKVFGGDVTTGGGFNGGANGTDSGPCLADFQAPTYTSPIGNPNKGGIMAFVNQSFTAGASSQLGAFSLGLIEVNGNASGNWGFFAGGDGTGGLRFANDKGSAAIANYGGGIFEDARLSGSAHQLTHCIPDYYTIKNTGAQALANPYTVNSLNFASGCTATSCKFLSSPGASNQYLNSNGGLNPGKNATLFIDGNVYIASNITYAGGYSDINVPKLAIVARGNIYVDPSVTWLDGFYIAQPKSGVADSGNIWTCHDNSTTVPTGQWLYDNCRTNSNLTVNGAFVAKQIQLTRVKGDVATATPNESAAVTGAAEIFNYTPEMVVGGGFFNQASNFGRIQSLVNLPPVF